ncbi:MAG TPA: homocysteine S-methyltransferase family protein [Methylomirabilota bacterium]|jgi:betaine-homocysteine S-methyltransferase
MVRRLFDEQSALQAAEGVDFFLGETFTFLEEARQCLQAIKAAGYPAMITFAVRDAETAEAVPLAEAPRILAGEGVDVIGANCGRDPERILPVVALMRRATSGYVAAQPIGFRTRDGLPTFTQLPEFPLALDSLTLSRAEMATHATTARALGVIGSCCGSVAHQVRAMAEALGRRPPASAISASVDRHPGIPKSRTLEEMAGAKPKSSDAPRFATGDRNW